MLPEFEQYLQNCLSALPEGKVKQAMAYSLLAPGKRVRPSLLFAVLQAYGIDPQKGFPAAAAVEMIHTYSLIHDDLPAMDDDDLRRGRPSCHKAFDEATAILAGDALQPLAFETLMQTDVPAETLKDMTKVLAQMAGAAGMVYGQDLDLHARPENCSLEQLEEVETYKTGCLLQLPLILAAQIANAKDDIDTWKRIGLLAGIQFQVQDDILDLTQTPEQLGKTSSDVRNAKATAASQLGLQKAQKKVRELDQASRDLLKTLPVNAAPVSEILDGLLARKR